MSDQWIKEVVKAHERQRWVSFALGAVFGASLAITAFLLLRV